MLIISEGYFLSLIKQTFRSSFKMCWMIMHILALFLYIPWDIFRHMHKSLHKQVSMESLLYAWCRGWVIRTSPVVGRLVYCGNAFPYDFFFLLYIYRPEAGLIRIL